MREPHTHSGWNGYVLTAPTCSLALPVCLLAVRTRSLAVPTCLLAVRTCSLEELRPRAPPVFERHFAALVPRMSIGNRRRRASCYRTCLFWCDTCLFWCGTGLSSGRLHGPGKKGTRLGRRCMRRTLRSMRLGRVCAQRASLHCLIQTEHAARARVRLALPERGRLATCALHLMHVQRGEERG